MFQTPPTKDRDGIGKNANALFFNHPLAQEKCVKHKMISAWPASSKLFLILSHRAEEEN